MKRLVDSSYLAAVGRCLDGSATSVNDIITFLRFVGEILVSDSILHTADETGPVYERVVATVERIAALGNEKKLLQHFSHQWVDYPRICDEAAQVIADELQYLQAEGLTQPDPGFEPEFASSMENPDISVLESLHEIRTGGLPKKPRLLTPATATRSIVSNEAVHDGLRRLINDGFEITDVTVSALSATMRMVIYAIMAQTLDADYLPATARAKLHSLPLRADHPKIAEQVKLDVRAYDGEESLSLLAAISAAVALAKGNPEQLLRLAFELRRETVTSRPLLRSGIPRDGCLEKDERLARQLGRALKVRLQQADSPSLIKALEPRIFMFGPVPTILLKIDRIGEWIEWKMRSRQISALADFLGKAKKYDTRVGYERLFVSSGVAKK